MQTGGGNLIGELGSLAEICARCWELLFALVFPQGHVVVPAPRLVLQVMSLVYACAFLPGMVWGLCTDRAEKRGQ